MRLFDFFKKKVPPQEWVDLIYEENTPAERVEMNDLIRGTKFAVENCNRIIQDSLRIMKSTNNIDTFFTRYKLLDDQLYFLTLLEPYWKFDGTKPTELLKASMDARYETVEPFLRVQFNKLWDFVHGSSSNRAKVNHINKYIKALETYKPQIPESVFVHFLRKSQKLLIELTEN